MASAPSLLISTQARLSVAGGVPVVTSNAPELIVTVPVTLTVVQVPALKLVLNFPPLPNDRLPVLSVPVPPVPGIIVPPALAVTVPLIVPVPPRMPVPLTVALLVVAPLTRSVAPETVVDPVYVLAPVKVWVPAVPV